MVAQYLALDIYKEKIFAKDTATRLGLFFTALTPVAIIAYSVVLLVLFLNRPVVLSTTSETTFFTAPRGILVNCSCSAGSSCFISHTYQSDNDLSAFCSNALALQMGNFSDTRVIASCYGVRASERVIVEVPAQCTLTGVLESRRNIPFNFSAPYSALQNVTMPFDRAPGTKSFWIYHRLREVHREQIDVPPIFPPTNLTVWWGEEERREVDSELCQDGTNQCTKLAFAMEAVFPVFIYERVGSVASLIAEIGGVVSLVLSLFYLLVQVYRISMYFLCDRGRLQMLRDLRRPDNPQPVYIGKGSKGGADEGNNNAKLEKPLAESWDVSVAAL